MQNPLFVVRCKIDGKPMCIGVQTHGSGSKHPMVPVIRTAEQAYEHVVRMSRTHEIEEEDGTVRYVHHIDAEGEEHCITDIEKDTVEIMTPEKLATLERTRAGTAEDVAAIAAAA